MNRTDELLFEIIETYQRHAKIAENAKYQETREMAEMIIDVDISAMWFLTQRSSDTKCRLM
ncbi:GNAT family acetyltransferase [Hungatella hathewayi]|uniref:GNAT family acetyltransferase n=1 Tax=Hungatella hathewayi TaxID=154046 RepID=UPI001C017232|nr:GNAT family acetyltransferase [Hungatella hathewayi]MBT9800645.1 GNAT family acetyltransferase [Hungatella hathewayi]